MAEHKKPKKVDLKAKVVLSSTREDDTSTDEDTSTWINVQRLLRKIPRDNANNPFKPQSLSAVKRLAEWPPGQELTPQEEKFLQNYGADLDRCTISGETYPPGADDSQISVESMMELRKLAPWLRTYIETKFAEIHKKHGSKTHVFLQQLVNRLEYRKLKQWGHEGLESLQKERHYVEEEEVLNTKEEIEKALTKQDSLLHHPHNTDEDLGDFVYPDPFLDKEDLLVDPEDADPEQWSPLLIQRASDALRAVLLAGASDSEGEEPGEGDGDTDDERETTTRVHRRGFILQQDDEKILYSGPHWEEIVAEKERLPELAEWTVNKEFTKDPGPPPKKDPKWKDVLRTRAHLFYERGVGKRPSRLYHKDPSKGPITHVKRHIRPLRPTESIHAYVNFIVDSVGFKVFIMAIIFCNAFLMAAEAGEDRETLQYLFDFAGSMFLSVYLVEFMLKFYANPVKYFRSGFNIFDFIILVISLVRTIVQWASREKYSFLRYFIIVRALRVLRGVSLSVHTQILVTALVETVKNHVLSVIILLVLLIYIIAIVAFYLFGSDPDLSEDWGSVPSGMLTLFAFVSMDGWTEVLKEFEQKGDAWVHYGRIFCLLCIIFGNFVFSNIFIAIIIMQISEATDDYRNREHEERGATVFMKHEAIFRRQKLDMRQLLARYKYGISDDFYDLGSKFVRRLRHDDLVDAREIIFSPLWIDSLYKGMQRSHHTSNILMNLHRKTVDRLVKLKDHYAKGKHEVMGITRSRYNRYLDVKAQLALLKQEFLEMRQVPPQRKLFRVKLPNVVETEEHGKPPPVPPPMPKKPVWKEQG